MALEVATNISQLDPANPAGADRLSSADDHIRLLKTVLKTTFPNVNGPITVTDEQINALAGGLWSYGDIKLTMLPTAPAGWAICNGQTVPKSDGSGNVTVPDLRDRAAIGASGTNALLSTTGASSQTVTTGAGGAQAAVAVTGDGSHTHNLQAAPVALSQGQVGVASTGGESGGSGPDHLVPHGGPTQSHTHAISHVSGADGTHGHTVPAVPGHSHSVTVATVPPSLALNYIMKI